MDFWSKHSAYNDDDENQQWKYNFMTGVQFLNHSIVQLRILKTKMILNRRAEVSDDAEVQALNQIQLFLQSTIELLQDDIIQRDSTMNFKGFDQFKADSQFRYHSGDFRMKNNKINTNPTTEFNIFISRNAELIVGYAYFCLGVVSRMLNLADDQRLIDKSYQHFKNIKNSGLKEMVKVELYKSNNPNKQVYDQSHPVFNSMFCITEDFVPLQTRITEIDIPQFTYYSSISNKNKSNLTGTLSTSNKVRFFDDMESSPITASIYNATYQEIASNFNKEQTKPSLEHGDVFDNQQQANINTSGISETSSSYGVGYVPQSILAYSNVEKKKKKKIIVIKKKQSKRNQDISTSPQNVLSQSTDQSNSKHAVVVPDLQEETADRDKINEKEEDLLIPLSNQFKFDVNQNENSESSVLVPLAEQDSLFSPKNSDIDAKQPPPQEDNDIQSHYDEEQQEKATVIQKLYRKKREVQKKKEQEIKEKELEDDSRKISIIQRRYCKKLEQRKQNHPNDPQDKAEPKDDVVPNKEDLNAAEQEQKEQNEKAAMIQKMYRAKKTKQRLIEEK